MDFLRDPFVGLIITTIVAIILTIVGFIQAKKRKELTYEVISNTLVLSVNEEVKDKIQVLYEGKSVEDARLVIVRIWNFGNEPIPSKDYESPLTFDFGEHAEILDASIFESHPSNLKDLVTVEKALNKVILKPFLLNKNESLNIKILLTKFGGAITANARISGINQILPPEELPIRKRIRKTERSLKRYGLLMGIGYGLVIPLMAVTAIMKNFMPDFMVSQSTNGLLFSSKLPVFLNILLTVYLFLTILLILIGLIGCILAWCSKFVLKRVERKRFNF